MPPVPVPVEPASARTSLQRSLAQLGLETADEAAIQRLVQQPLGLVLVVGPRRSGLSTTLAALAGVLPVPSGAACGSEPDLLLLDPPPAPAALRRAIASIPVGRRVFSSLPLERAAHVFGHFRALGLSPALLARDLQLVIAQRLVRRLCVACRQPDRSADLRGAMAQAANSWLADTAWEAFCARTGGCAQCAGQGTAGHVLAYELMAVDSGVRALAEQGAIGLDMEQALFADGRSLWERGLRLVACGLCSLDALRAAVREPR
jgi:type II secretory ATPase GspE/PulE/Tfp pilus assembly ATPase PilB-like protein